jgi:hypothetical protein
MHEYSVQEKANYVKDYILEHNMQIGQVFYQELLDCKSIADITAKLLSYKPGIYEIANYSFLGYYPKVMDCISYVFDHHLLVGSVALVCVSLFIGLAFFSVKNTVVSPTNSSNNLTTSVQQNEIASVGLKAIIETLALIIPFPQGYDGIVWKNFVARLNDVYKFVSNGKNISDFLNDNNVPPNTTINQGYVLGHGDNTIRNNDE